MAVKLGYTIVKDKLLDVTYIISNMDTDTFTLTSTIDSLIMKRVAKNGFDKYYRITGEIQKEDGLYKKSVKVSKLKSGDILHRATYLDFLTMIKNRDWNVVREEIDEFKPYLMFYNFYYNFNSGAILFDLYKEGVDKEEAIKLSKEYEKEIWAMHKNSVYEDGIYHVLRNDNAQFDLEPDRTLYPDALVPVMKPAKIDKEIEMDIEMDNPVDSGHGSLVPCTMTNTDTSPRVRPRNIERLRTEPEDKVEWLDRISFSVR